MSHVSHFEFDQDEFFKMHPLLKSQGADPGFEKGGGAGGVLGHI